MEGIRINLLGDYVYKKEVDWSLLTEGLTLPLENQVVFSRNMGKILIKGEVREINLYLNGKSYKAQIRNVKFNINKYKRKDILQIRYRRNGELADALKGIYLKSYNFILEKRLTREPGVNTQIKLPEEYKEYLAIYTTEHEDTYLLETIVANDIYALKEVVGTNTERFFESSFNYDVVDESASIFEDERIVKIRKLNRAIGDNLKLLYEFRCQICGLNIGTRYNSQVVEAHHIDYFVKSLNNGVSNQMVVCPNHHSIIHERNPVFNRTKKYYTYENGLVEGLILNYHI
jgi:hypothetical protein